MHIVAPWSSETPTTEAVQLLVWLREMLRICGILLQPFIPSSAERLLSALGVPENERSWNMASVGKGGTSPGPIVPTMLFPRRMP